MTKPKGEFVGRGGMTSVEGSPKPRNAKPETFSLSISYTKGTPPPDERPIQIVPTARRKPGQTVSVPTVQITSDDTPVSGAMTEVSGSPVVRAKEPTVSLPVVEVDGAKPPKPDGVVHSPHAVAATAPA